jgi:EAL domain-containing protein (putative c-di-GMP-specific phosphodiesterase class I)
LSTPNSGLVAVTIVGAFDPHKFLQAAETNGLANKIDTAILRGALRDLTVWGEHGAALDQISVNISASQLRDPMIGHEIADLNISKGRLCFELLETTFLEADQTTLIGNVKMFRQIGIDIEIDDFGSGYASTLSFFKILPNRLKIDHTPITKSRSQRKIVATIVEIAKP